ncbi:MAG: Mrp/NBP35 family ATP-binding protein [Pseudomonadota bacterium]|nr:Mrp/NBP35 family ATP-binding protein [Pseudomonadota bacterium]MDE3037602.1 Mrp/NBP35 family ATP-binding protein [Pseudomonadota bacterium]
MYCLYYRKEFQANGRPVMPPEKPDPAINAGMKKPAVWNFTPLEGVKRIVAVASGKGGVGKSTAAVNLAHALTRLKQRAGLLDADIYGPSIPRMMALSGQPEIKDNKMQPLIAHGIPCMSMGFITGGEAAIMRGPMISKTLYQLLRSTAWGTKENPLDMLLVDMPPGTGDIALSMAQQVPLDGAIIVTTPQQVAVVDARKALQMFQKVHVKILGVVENMSGGMFGAGGGRKLAEETGVPFLGAIPIDAAIVEAGDEGKVYEGKCAETYAEIADTLRGAAGRQS